MGGKSSKRNNKHVGLSLICFFVGNRLLLPSVAELWLNLLHSALDYPEYYIQLHVTLFCNYCWWYWWWGSWSGYQLYLHVCARS